MGPKIVQKCETLTKVIRTILEKRRSAPGPLEDFCIILVVRLGAFVFSFAHIVARPSHEQYIFLNEQKNKKDSLETLVRY